MSAKRDYFYIREVADKVGLKESVLRFWEKEFEFLRPITNNAKHRKYTKRDINLIKKIKYLVYDEKYTIPGARQKILELKKKNINIFDDFNPDVFKNQADKVQAKPNQTIKPQEKTSKEQDENLSKAIEKIAETIDENLPGQKNEKFNQNYQHNKNQQQVQDNTGIINSSNYKRVLNNQNVHNQKPAIQRENNDNVIPISKKVLINELKEILNLLK